MSQKASLYGLAKAARDLARGLDKLIEAETWLPTDGVTVKHADEAYVLPGDTVRLTTGLVVRATDAWTGPGLVRLARPRFEHECPNCVCLGQFDGVDFYFCADSIHSGTNRRVIVRQDGFTPTPGCWLPPSVIEDEGNVNPLYVAALARAREWGLLKEEPKFKVGQWVKDQMSHVWPIARRYYKDGEWYYDSEPDGKDGGIHAGFPESILTPSAPDFYYYWPNGAPWPGEPIWVVSHPTDASGAPYPLDDLAPDQQLAGKNGIVEKLSGEYLLQGPTIFALGEWLWAWNCVPAKDAKP
jgi:hypothetical protein